MKTFYAEIGGDEVLGVNVDAKTVAKAEKEFEKYMSKRGDIYSLDNHKEPSASFFFSTFFGEWEDGCWCQPNFYVCTNKNVAERLYQMAKEMAFYDEINECGKDVSLQVNKVIVTEFYY